MAGHIEGATLASLSVLEGIPRPDLDRIGAAMELRHAAAGAVLGIEGTSGDQFWLVLAGELAVTQASSHTSRLLATARVGSILGELAVLRGQPRSATVTATTPATLAVGNRAVLEELLEIEIFHDRIRRLASIRLAHDLRPVPATLADGTAVLVRPLLPEDRQAFDDEVRRMSRDSLRRRFFSPGGPSPALVDYLIDIDYVDHFAWVALNPANHGEGWATARYIRSDPADRAEMAFGTGDRNQGRGIGTFLFGALGVAAVEAGISMLFAHVLEDNRAMRAVFAKARPTSHFAEPGVIKVELRAADAAGLIDPATRARLSSAVHDVVTAASLALTGTPTTEGPLGP